MQLMQLILISLLLLFGSVSPFGIVLSPPPHTFVPMSSSPGNSAAGGDDASPAPFIKCCVVEVKPERAEEFSNLCKIAQSESIRNEPGCLRLDILRVAANDDGSSVIKNKFIVYEIFKDKEAYEHHGKQPYSHDVGAFVQSGGIAHEDAYVAQKLFMTEE